MNESANDDKEATTRNTLPQPPKNEDFKPLFSEEEIRSIVKSFITAWLGNEVKVDFPTIDSVKYTVKLERGKIDDSLTHQVAHEIKSDLTNLISICSGRTSATPSQQKKAMYDIFHALLVFRSGDRIDGHFIHNPAEERLSGIEGNISELNKHFEELYFYVRTKLP